MRSLEAEAGEMRAMDSIPIKLTIAYDGTAYQGWQVQKIGLGVQQKVEEAIGRIFPSVRRIRSSSRTDTGVHAVGMVADMAVPRGELRMPLRKVPLALNAFLPEDIRVVSAVRVSAAFHARFDARGKQYSYFIWNHPVMNPLLRRTAWHVPTPLDVSTMRAAVRHLRGRRDFRSFAANHTYAIEDTVRTLQRCELKRSGPLLTFVLEGDGFLYKMCRGIVGTLVQLGRGKFTEAELKAMVAAQDRRVAGMTAPAHGLVLWKVFYGRKAGRRVATRVSVPARAAVEG
jgi:tRNA pseudouridine38-40 synthase